MVFGGAIWDGKLYYNIEDIQRGRRASMNHNELAEWYEAAYSRGILDMDEVRARNNQVKGQLGEGEFHEWVKEYMSEDLLILKNKWLTTGGGKIEIDHLIMMPTLWIVTEVKNYEGEFSYYDSNSYLDEFELDNNIFTRAESVHKVVSAIAERFSYPPKVVTNLVFINEHCHVSTDYNGPVKVLMRSQLRKALWNYYEMAGELRYYKDPNSVISHINSFEFEPSFSLPSDKNLHWDKLIKGIHCPNPDCYSFNLLVGHKGFTCSCCGHYENKSSAALRTIKDYCVLFRKDTFTVDELIEFMGESVSQSLINRVIQDKYPLADGYQRKRYKFR